MRRIAVLTSGGDAPGMNAAIRGAVRHGVGLGIEVVGIRRGFAGLLAGELEPLPRSRVGNAIQRGGTILGTSRSERFRSLQGRARAAATLRHAEIEGLVVIGGGGTFHGASLLADEHGFPVVGVPATIDNDVVGTDYSVGFDTAVNTALEAIDRIRDSASSRESVFLVEVMGRDCAEIAVAVGLAGGSEAVIIPHTPTDLAHLATDLWRSWERGKRSSIIVVAEGGEQGRAFRVAKGLHDITGLEPRVCVLGHIQRGGSPTARDRILGSRLGAAAVDALAAGGGVMVGERGGEIVRVPLAETWAEPRQPPLALLRLAHDLA